MTPRIIIPHGLAADVLRVLHGRYGWQRDDDSLELWSADGSTWARIPLCDVDADGAPVLFYRTGAEPHAFAQRVLRRIWRRRHRLNERHEAAA